MKRLMIAGLVLLMNTGISLSDEHLLAGSEWGYAGQDLPFVAFGVDGKITGNSGCNRFFGSFEITGAGTLTIGPLATTKMLCPDQQMETEKRFLDLLGSAKTFERIGHELLIKDDSGEIQATFALRDWD